MNKPILLLSVQAAALALALVPAESSASLILLASRRFPGSACVQVGTAGVLRVTNDDGAIFNDAAFGGSSLTVDCPVLANRSGAASASADLWYLDNSTSSISCTYRSEDKLSTAVNQQSLSSVGDDNLYRRMTFTVSHFNDGNTHIRCTIPPRDSAGNASFIVGYAGW
jgi:hypothetical protein